jgi:hypothetical protein
MTKSIAQLYPEGFSEFDHTGNKLSRSIIRAMKREHGKAYIYTVNANKYNPVVTEYIKGMVFNFSGSFVASVYDQNLIDLIRDRLAAPYTGTKDDWDRVTAIFDYAESINAVTLHWS